MGGLMSRSKSSDEFPTSVLLFTQNIARHPIAWDPARQRPTQEVIHAVHSALHFALDTCVDHPEEALSFGVQDGVLTIPNNKDLKVKEPPRTGWEVHVKLFICGNAGQDCVGILERSLSELHKVVGTTALESFVVSLNSVAWHGEKDAEAAGLDEVDGLVNLWKAISNRSELRNVGVADFSAEHLKRLLALVDSKDSAAPLRKPRINQVNLAPSTDDPAELLELTKREGINLQTHADDLGTTKQMVGLLSEFEDRLPLSPAFIRLRNEESYDKALPMEWILKYTIFNQDRGIVGEKGYIVSAQIAK